MIEGMTASRTSGGAGGVLYYNGEGSGVGRDGLRIGDIDLTSVAIGV